MPSGYGKMMWKSNPVVCGKVNQVVGQGKYGRGARRIRLCGGVIRGAERGDSERRVQVGLD